MVAPARLLKWVRVAPTLMTAATLAPRVTARVLSLLRISAKRKPRRGCSAHLRASCKLSAS